MTRCFVHNRRRRRDAGDNSVEPDASTGARRRPKASNVRRVVVCTGQVYYKLHSFAGRKARRTWRWSDWSSSRRFRTPRWRGDWRGTQTPSSWVPGGAQEHGVLGVRSAPDQHGGEGDTRGGGWTIARRSAATTTATTTATAAAGTRRTRSGRTEGVLFVVRDRRDEVRRVRRGAAGGGAPARRVRRDSRLETRALVHEALGLEHVGIHLAEPRSSVPRY